MTTQLSSAAEELLFGMLGNGLAADWDSDYDLEDEDDVAELKETTKALEELKTHELIELIDDGWEPSTAGLAVAGEDSNWQIIVPVAI